jgi:hypothetical protein
MKTKEQLVELLEQIALDLPGANTTAEAARTYFNGFSQASLQTTLDQAIAELEQKAENMLEKRIQFRAARDAEKAVWQMEMEKRDKPRREAQAKEDRETFFQAAKQYKSFSICDANFSLLRQALGEGFDIFQVAQAVRLLNLVPATEQELAQYRAEEIQVHNEYLQNASPEELRRIIRNQVQERSHQAAQAYEQQQLQAIVARDDGFPQIPEVAADDTRLDASFFTKLSNTNLESYKQYLRKYGNANLTARLRGLR